MDSLIDDMTEGTAIVNEREQDSRAVLRRERPGSAGPAEGVLRRRERVTMLLGNNPYPQDSRVRHEAESLVAAGHRVEVVAPRWPGQPAREHVNGVAVRRFRAMAGGGAGIAAAVLEYATATLALHVGALRGLFRGSTVLHVHNPPDTLFLAGAIYRIAGRKVVFDHHDLGPELVSVRWESPPLVFVAHVAERLTFAVATHVISTNESYAELACRRGRKSADRVTVVRNGPPEEWTQMPISVRPGCLRTVHLAYLGTIAQQDGLDAIAEVLAWLRRRNPPVDATLTVIGDGDGRVSFEEALARWDVTNVTVTGWVPSEQVPLILRDVDVCVDPAPATPLNERSTMMKLAEYLALGKPVVAYELTETKRTVGYAARLAPRGDKQAFAEEIAALAADGQIRSELAQRARRRGRELTWQTAEPALLDLYAGLDGDSTLHGSQ